MTNLLPSLEWIAPAISEELGIAISIYRKRKVARAKRKLIRTEYKPINVVSQPFSRTAILKVRSIKGLHLYRGKDGSQDRNSRKARG